MFQIIIAVQIKKKHNNFCKGKRHKRFLQQMGITKINKPYIALYKDDNLIFWTNTNTRIVNLIWLRFTILQLIILITTILQVILFKSYILYQIICEFLTLRVTVKLFLSYTCDLWPSCLTRVLEFLSFCQMFNWGTVLATSVCRGRDCSRDVRIQTQFSDSSQWPGSSTYSPLSIFAGGTLYRYSILLGFLISSLYTLIYNANKIVLLADKT